MVTIITAGQATVRARQNGNASYSAATPVDQIFCVNPVKPTITVSNLLTNSAILTSSATSGNQWFRNGTKITGAISNVYQATTGGLYSVKVKVETCTSASSDDENLLITTGDITTQALSTLVYPNPTRDKLYLDLSAFEASPVDIRAIDISGRQTFRESHTGGQTVELDISNHASGAYFLLITQGGSSQRVRWVKQ